MMIQEPGLQAQEHLRLGCSSLPLQHSCPAHALMSWLHHLSLPTRQMSLKSESRTRPERPLQHLAVLPACAQLALIPPAGSHVVPAHKLLSAVCLVLAALNS